MLEVKFLDNMDTEATDLNIYRLQRRPLKYFC